MASRRRSTSSARSAKKRRSEAAPSPRKRFGGARINYTKRQVEKLAERKWSGLTANQQRAVRQLRATKGADTKRAKAEAAKAQIIAEKVAAAKRRQRALKGWQTRRARPKHGGRELWGIPRLVDAVAHLPGTGRGETPRNLAHRALYDRLFGVPPRVDTDAWIDVITEYSDLDREEASDVLLHYH